MSNQAELIKMMEDKEKIYQETIADLQSSLNGYEAAFDVQREEDAEEDMNTTLLRA